MHRRFLLLAAVLLLPGIALAEYSKEDRFTIRTPGFGVVIRPETAFTIGQITYRGMPLGQANGNWGFVISYGGSDFVGSGHTEGGVEQIKNVSLTLDGRKLDKMPLGEQIESGVALLEKTALLGEAVEIDCKTEITAETIKATHIMRVKADTNLTHVYPFMFIWPETTSEYMYGLADGTVNEGELVSDGQWQVQAHSRWMAIYNPQYGLAAVTVFPENMPYRGDQGRKHAFWDHPAYHKQYFEFADRQDFSAGEEFRFDVELFVVEGDPSNWKERVKAALAQKGITSQ